MTTQHSSHLILAALILTLAVLGGFAVREWDRRHSAPKFGVVDIAAIMAAKEKSFTALLLKPGVSDEEKKRAFAQIGEFGAELNAIMSRLPAECRCEVLNKAAYLGGNAIDLTPSIKKRLGLP